VKIIGSSDLDEYVIHDLKQKGAKISIWGVGTHLVTAYDQPALGGVYKLVALQDAQKKWQLKLKKSDDPIKHSIPGIHNIRRVVENDHYIKDIVYTLQSDITDLKQLSQEDLPQGIDLMKPIFREGKLIYKIPSLNDSRNQLKENLKKFKSTITDIYPTETYPVLFPVDDIFPVPDKKEN
jgi:nicotinate phosphoribosyltransferase